jgi:PIN domain nuclease of toxin-antitoxin system
MAIKYLLDTHVIIWWLLDDPQLSKKAKNTISKTTNPIIISSVSAWEISIKHQLGKLPELSHIFEKFSSYIQNEHFEILPITLEHALLAGKLPDHHKDPFDRMLLAQAKIEHLTIVSTDTIFAKYKAPTLW